MYPSQHTCCQCWALRDPISEKIAIFILYFSEKKVLCGRPIARTKVVNYVYGFSRNRLFYCRVYRKLRIKDSKSWATSKLVCNRIRKLPCYNTSWTVAQNLFTNYSYSKHKETSSYDKLLRPKVLLRGETSALLWFFELTDFLRNQTLTTCSISGPNNGILHLSDSRYK